jgi:type IV pilus assembly protein PilO
MDINNPKTARLLFLAIGAAAILYLNFFTALVPFSYKAQAQELGELRGRYEKVSLEVNRARQSLKNLPHLEAEFEALQGKWTEANQLLPNEKQIISLFREISFRGQSCGVDFVLFKPAGSANGDFYRENLLSIEVEGGYHQIAAFLNEVANMVRIINVRDLEIEQLPPRESPKFPAKASFTAVAYTLGTGPADGGAEGVGAIAQGVKQKVQGRREHSGEEGGSEE